MKFTLEIELGNDAMQTYEDIAHSVRRIFSDFAQIRRDEIAEDDRGSIYDANGNRVGQWEIGE